MMTRLSAFLIALLIAWTEWCAASPGASAPRVPGYMQVRVPYVADAPAAPAQTTTLAPPPEAEPVLEQTRAPEATPPTVDAALNVGEERGGDLRSDPVARSGDRPQQEQQEQEETAPRQTSQGSANILVRSAPGADKDVRAPVGEGGDAAESAAPLAVDVEQAVAIVLEQNPQALVAAEEVIISHERVGQAESQRLPQVKTRAAYSYVEGLEDELVKVPLVKDLVGNLRPQPGTTTTQVIVQQTLYAGGQIQAAIRASEFLAQSQEWQREATLQQLAFDTRQTFYAVLLTEALVNVAQESIGTFERHRSDAQKLLDEGIGTKLELLRAETELSARQANLESATTAHEIALLNLRRLLGVAQDAPLQLNGSLEETPVELPVEEMVATAQGQRAELRAIEAGVQAAEQQVAMKRGAFKPKAAATAQYQDVDGGGAALPDGWSFTVGAEWDLYAGGRRKHEVAEARAKLRSVEHQQTDVQRLVEMDVRQATLRVGEAAAKIEKEKSTVALAEEALRMASLRFEEGVGTQTEMLDAELALTQARTQLAQALHDHAVAHAALTKALGNPLQE
ncbi:MAG: TolC family protein [Candidatus Hydrogenedentes bacterium]|nr:TolC family protein [Candidatus Hydrogenedentota bacterium]